MWARVLMLVCLGGCARFGFDAAGGGDGAAPDLARDRGGDISVADLSGSDGLAPPPVACDWSSGPTIQQIEPLTTLNSSTTDADPFLAADGLTLYFSSIRSGNFDIYSAKRATPGGVFGNVQPVAGLNTSAAETRVEIVAGGTVAYLNTDRTGGPGKHDVWVGTRSSTTGPFSGWKPVANVNSPGEDYDHHITADGLLMLFTSSERPDAVGGQDIYVAERSSITASFPAPTVLQGISTSQSENNPSLTADRRTIVFTRCDTSCDLYYATRPDPTAPFGPAKPVPGVNTTGYEGEAFARPDGCELFFIRRVDASHWDLFRAAVSP